MRGKEAFVAGLVSAFLIGAPAAHAACDYPVAKAKAVSHGAGAASHGPAPLAIGDSTMVFAVPFLSKLGFDANARVCRTWKEGLGIMRDRKRRHRLPDLVVMALGANSTVRPIDVREALRIIGPHRTLGLVTHRTWFGKPGPDTGVIRKMARRYRNRVELIDWVAYARPHPSWFVIDGLHTNTIGSKKFASLIARVPTGLNYEKETEHGRWRA